MTKVLDAMGHAVHVFDVEHVLIDNLQFMLGSSGYSSGLDKFSDQDRVRNSREVFFVFINFFQYFDLTRFFYI